MFNLKPNQSADLDNNLHAGPSPSGHVIRGVKSWRNFGCICDRQLSKAQYPAIQQSVMQCGLSRGTGELMLDANNVKNIMCLIEREKFLLNVVSSQ